MCEEDEEQPAARPEWVFVSKGLAVQQTPFEQVFAVQAC